MNVPGITNSDMSATINNAVKRGWVHLGTKKGHTVGQIQWPATGEIVNYSTTPKAGGWKTVADQIYKISGIDLRRKGNTAPIRKSLDGRRGAALERARQEREELERQLAEQASAPVVGETEGARYAREAKIKAELEEARRREEEAAEAARNAPYQPKFRIPSPAEIPWDGDPRDGWSIGDARTMVRQGYQPGYVHKATGVGMKWINDLLDPRWMEQAFQRAG